MTGLHLSDKQVLPLDKGYLPHMAEFGEFVDEIRAASRRPIHYKSREWELLYLAYIAGRTDALREERELVEVSHVG